MVRRVNAAFEKWCHENREAGKVTMARARWRKTLSSLEGTDVDRFVREDES
jgi:hypothetical protein